MSSESAPVVHLTQSSWSRSVREAMTPENGGFRRRSISRGREPMERGDGVRGEATRNRSLLRAWLYQDVHVRMKGHVSSFLGYRALPVSSALREATVRTRGWRLDSGRLIHEQRRVSLVPRDACEDGFVHAGGEVELPRLRCGTAPGWLTVAGMNGEVPPQCHRLYLPGVGLERVEVLVHALDSSPAGIAWSLKSSVGVDRDGVEVPRADRTVVYLEAPTRSVPEGLPELLDTISAHAPVAPGPGFSVELRPGVYFGGSGNDHGSFGTRMAGIAADALVDGDLSPVERSERAMLGLAERLRS